jgi:phosphoribosyl 1,2-cyclic phosphodiesterase
VRASIWGSRGSLASPGPLTVRYGGNTSCVEVTTDDGTLVILDAGSGIRDLGARLMTEERRPIHIVLSHLHLDHLQGLAFFEPFWREDVELHIWGPSSPIRSLAERVRTYVSPPLFPVHLSDVPSRPVFHDIPDEPWNIGGALLSGCPVAHQGPTAGIRIEADGRSLAYIPDHEPALGVDLRQIEPDWISGYGVAAGVDVLLHDAQYSDDEYPSRVGWGHSTIAHAVDFALATDVAQLVLFHHDPAHSDERLEELGAEAVARWGSPTNAPVLAAEGATICLDADGVTMMRSGAEFRQQPVPAA